MERNVGLDQDFRYIGCFLDPEELARKVKPLGKQRLERVIANPHVTFRYHPETVDRSLFGEKIVVAVVGYGCDGENEGLKVQLQIENPRLAKLAERIAVPHITLSVSADGESVNTRYLVFSPVEPFTLTAVFGGFTLSGKVVTE